ncbi:hypothetical protein M433DRAFT_68212 [Acidomyces richmondensis BFW]|nr:MAG: hypothetical protein FE78DRAFT_32587 [Acidomyces sp. 'richmondensis']KYG45003.1 hypothetical protein M433DRAFT_68212 [Acidomyces richmondensis BFW]
MAGASDKARFYLEQYVPELQEYERKEIFSREEIAAITSKRSDFEHILNAPGSRPSDYARYATYEMNLDTLRKKRSKRLGVKATKGFTGQRTVFFILDRATKKFPGDMGLWMQYIEFCQKEKANKKLARVFTSVLRLKPREYGLWVLAAKCYAEQYGDMSTARSYMQRGLRFCKDELKLWLEYAKLEMVYLAKLAARRKILGLEDRLQDDVEMEDNEDVIALPPVTAEELQPDTRNGLEEVDGDTLRRLVSTPAYTGAIPIAIFDSAMKQFHNSPATAEDFFLLVSSFESVPSAKRILQHILEHLRSSAPSSPETITCAARLGLVGIDAGSIAFPSALSESLSCIKTGLAVLSEEQKTGLLEKTIQMLAPYLKHGEVLDEDVRTALMASIKRYLRTLATAARCNIRSKPVIALLDIYDKGEKITAELIQSSWQESGGKA